MMTAKDALKFLSTLIDKKAAARTRVTFAFRFTGDEPGEYALEIDRGECRFHEGIPPKPDVTIECPSELWASIANGSSSVGEARKSGAFTIRGKIWKMMWFNKYFSGDPEFCEVEDGAYVWTENEIEIREGKWTPPKHVLGIQASPRKRKGATDWLYSRLMEGMSEAGAEVDTVYLAERKFESCRGCFTCWTKRPGECIHRDDATDLISAFPSYDSIVLAAPLYVDGLPGPLKTFLDRLMLLVHPSIINRKGRSRHPSRFKRMPNLVLASVCGFAEMENFDPLVAHVKAISQNGHMPLVASVLRPTAMLLLNDDMKGWRERIGEAAKEAGKEIVRSGRVRKATLKAVSQPIVTRGQFFLGSRDWWKNL